MNKVFNGQINVSRDLRQNKRAIIGKYSGEDLIFIVLAVGIAVLMSYYIGFYLELVDEYFAILLSIIPMLLILMLGFRQKAGMRYIDYLKIVFYSKKSKNRVNVIYDNDREFINDYLFTKINMDIEFKFKSVIDLLLNNEIVNSIKLEKINNKTILYVKYNYNIKRFVKEYELNQLSFIVNGKTGINKLISLIKYKVASIFKKNLKTKIVCLNLFEENFFPMVIKNFYSFIKANGFSIKNDIINNNENLKDVNICMMHLYDTKTYEDIINDFKDYNIIVFLKKNNKFNYVNTYIVYTKDSQIEIDGKLIKNNVIVNSLKYNQRIAKSIIDNQRIINPFNAYRRLYIYA